MPIKLGIIGAGTIGKIHLQTAKRVGLPVTFLADVNEDAARKLIKEEGVPAIAGSADDLIASPDVDAVIIGVPNKFHMPLTLAALQAGKDVLVEKPMGLNVAQCVRMNAAAAKNKRILQVGFINRYRPAAQIAREFVAAGRLGKIYHLKANYYRRRGIPGLGGWFTTKALSGGGPVMDIGVHAIDAALYVAGHPRPLRVSGKTYQNFGKDMKRYVYEYMWAGPPRFDGTFDVEDSAHAFVRRLEGGVTMDVNVAWAGNFPDSSVSNIIGVFGDKGGLTFQLEGKDLRLAVEEQGRNVDVIPKLPEYNIWDQQLRAFLSAIETRKPPHASGAAGQAVQSILDAAYKSSRLDREVEVKR